MAGNKTVRMIVQTGINMQPIAQGLNQVSNMVKNKPINLRATVKGIDSTQAQEAIDAIQAKAQSIDKIVIKSKTYINALGTAWKDSPVAMITTYTDKLGNSITETKKLTDALKNHTDYRPDSTGTKTATIDYQKQSKMVEQERNKNIALMAAANKKAEEWSTRAQNMSKKEGAAIQAQAEKVQKLSAAYERAQKRGSSGSRILKQWEAENNELNKQIDLTKRAATGVQGWTENIKRAFVQSVSYATSLGVLRLAQQALNQAIQFAIQLNKEMVNIQILQVEGAQTPEEINSLAQSFNNLAKEMGATTIEIAQGSVEWLRQGKTIAETQELLKSSTMMAKLGNMTLADSTEALTSVLNSFKLEAEDAVGIVDKLVAVDNVAATSTSELAVALRYVAAVAGESGVSIEQLISYIAVMSQTTRLNAEQIGQAMKTMFTRMQDIQKGGLDADGMGINNVEIALKRVNIELRDSATSFKDFGGVLEELAGKWEGLNEIEQANIGKSIAGVRQANLFRILMTNMNEAIELQEVQFNSAGLAVDRYGFYLDSVEGSSNTLKASLEGLFLTFKGTDDAVISVNKLASSILDFITKAGGLKTIIAAAMVALIGFQIEGLIATIPTMINWAVNMGIMTVSTGAFTFSVGAATKAILIFLATNPVGWAILAATAIGGISYAFDGLEERIQKSSKEFQDIQNEILGLGRKTKEIEDLAEEFNNLYDNTSKSTTETKRFTEVQNELKKVMPELVGQFNAYGEFIISSKLNVDELTKSTLELIDAKKKLAVETALENAGDLNKLYKKNQDTYDNWRGVDYSGEEMSTRNVAYLGAQDEAKTAFAEMGEEDRDAYIAKLTDGLDEVFIEFRKELDRAANKVKKPTGGRGGARGTNLRFFNEEEFRGAIDNLKSGFQELTDAEEKLFENGGELTSKEREEIEALGITLTRVGDTYTMSTEERDKYIASLREQVAAGHQLTAIQQAELDGILPITTAMEAQKDMTNELVGSISMLDSVMEEQEKNGELSLSTVMSLIDAGYAEALQLNVSTGAYKVNAAALKVLIIEKINAQIATNKLAIADLQAIPITVANVNVIRAQVAALQEKNAALKGLIVTVKAYNYVAPQLSGGGSGGKSETSALESQIKALEKKKDALKETLKEFKKYIDAQKESLKLARDKDKFDDEMAKKNLSLSKMQARMAILGLDNSEEARAELLKLQEDANELEMEIAEDQEDRKYDLQVDALDKVYEQFEEGINKQIEAIDALIEMYREQGAAQRAESNASTGAFVANKEIEERTLEEMKTAYADYYASMSEAQKKKFTAEMKFMKDIGLQENEILKLLLAEIELRDALSGETTSIPKYAQSWIMPTMYHEGGVVGEEDVTLKENEEFAKLLKGEVVVTEGEASDFMNNTLPTMTGAPTGTPIGNAPIQISMPINVAGNLDKSVLPDLEAMINKTFEKMNGALLQKGIKRSTDQFSA